MRIPAKVTVESRLADQNETTTASVACLGYLVLEGDTLSLTYREEDEEGGRSYTTLTPEGDGVRLHRAGALRMDTRLVAGESTTCVWGVPPYSFDMHLDCHAAEITLTQEGGRVLLDYDRHVMGDTARVRVLVTATKEVDA